MDKKKKPAEEFMLGHIRASIWANTDKKGATWFNTDIVRRYKDDDGEWQSSSQFGLTELPLVAKAADRAMNWILDQKKTNGREDNESRADD